MDCLKMQTMHGGRNTKTATGSSREKMLAFCVFLSLFPWGGGEQACVRILHRAKRGSMCVWSDAEVTIYLEYNIIRLFPNL